MAFLIRKLVIVAMFFVTGLVLLATGIVLLSYLDTNIRENSFENMIESTLRLNGLYVSELQCVSLEDSTFSECDRAQCSFSVPDPSKIDQYLVTLGATNGYLDSYKRLQSPLAKDRKSFKSVFKAIIKMYPEREQKRIRLQVSNGCAPD